MRFANNSQQEKITNANKSVIISIFSGKIYFDLIA